MICPAFLVSDKVIETEYSEPDMATGKKHTAEQVVNLLRQIEVGIAKGKTTVQGARKR